MAEVWVRLPLGALMRGTVRQLVERPSSNLGACGFNSHLCHFRRKRGTASVARWAARPPVKRPSLWAMWVRFPPEAQGSFFQRPGYQVVNLAMRVQFPYEPLLMRPCDGPFV